MRYKVKKKGQSRLLTLGASVCLCAGMGAVHAQNPPKCGSKTCVTACPVSLSGSDVCSDYYTPIPSTGDCDTGNSAANQGIGVYCMPTLIYTTEDGQPSCIGDATVAGALCMMGD